MYEQTNCTVDLNQGKPSDSMTDDLWQDYFAQMKIQVKPSHSRYMVYPHNRERDGEYYGETTYQTYCMFINSVLRTIRTGERDYCFYIYQIAELLKHEPQLQCKWLEDEQCFQVWLKGR